MEIDTNRAIALYRRLKLKEWETEREEQVLHAFFSDLTFEEFKVYVEATQAIDAAMDEVQGIINANHYAFSTEKSMMHQAANREGRDRTGV